ncbi:citrate/2-methylcitrate synthase [Chitinispirillales bacterium ANBcel5]|uniref:citrate/2-methylcitrate synthase n=1 Tax=Cellulosispirillum alkaliphilum TaxID=3039283 RepID=UPI002A556E2A|nr:citrate/2-methylcitrate synthase [Chitinispirillales bacterium ANBcel5]
MNQSIRKKSAFELNHLSEIAELAYQKNKIEQQLYQKYNVKRGLRNADGTGVLVGLTKIGDVHGYILDENEKVPVEGRLRYRGIDIKEIIEGCRRENRPGFNEVIYLLLFGNLPNRDQLEHFKEMLGACRDLPNGFTENMILKAPSRNIMNKLARSVLACYSYDENPDDLSIENVLRQSIELIARFPTLVSYAYQAKCHYYDGKSLVIHKPQPELSTAENILHMIRPDSCYTQLEAETLDLCLIIHAEHGGGNNSAFALHVVSSSDTDTYSAIAAAVGAMKGPKHGGANIYVADMMEEIKQQVKDWKDEDEISAYLSKILNKEAFDRTGLIYGMGHAVYTLSDPRTMVLKGKAEELARAKNREDEFELFRTVERLAPEVFAQFKGRRHLAANVDFYSGFVYNTLNIPKELYTPIFAISRIAGWSAHRIEEIVSGGKIIRPAYKSVSAKKPFTPIDQR